MDLLATFRRCLSRPVTRRPTAPAEAVDGPDEARAAEDDDATTAAPRSVLESSWVLRAGVAVIEHERLDPVAADLPLAWWIDGPGAARMPRPAPAVRPSSPRCR